jgi:cell division protein FtsZ
MCDEILKQAVEGISEIIRLSGRMNLDFSDIRRILKDSGTALFGMGRGVGENRAIEAATAAISNPLLDVSIHNATGLLYVVFGNEELTLLETADASRIITESVSKEAKIIYGIYNDETLKKDEIKVTVIATGFPGSGKNRESMRDRIAERENISLRAEPKIDNSPTLREAIRESEKVEDAGRIENSFDEGAKKAEDKVEKFSKEEAKKTKALEDEDEDDWGSLPPFLKRNRK